MKIVGCDFHPSWQQVAIFDPETGELMEAAKQGALEDIRSIAGSHPELVNQLSELRATALHYAAFGGHCLVAKLP